MPIRPLDPLVVNQIAAGEVIERPASVVKELVENAFDAEATHVRVAIEGGGRTLVRVTDDGTGIEPDELELAVRAHATSKITSVDDLDHIATMGFRGEALASIASVSELTLRSRRADDECAHEIAVRGADREDVRPAAGPKGTTIVVRNLFFNTPARRKFLKTDQTETTRVVELMQNLALAHPAIAFELSVDGRARLDLPAAARHEERVVAVLGADLAPELLEFGATAGGIRLWGMAGTPDLARPTARHVRAFLNGRPINDRSIHHAVKEAYRGLIEPGRSPTIVLFIEMDPAAVDVNVHPAKAEVRFRDQSSVHRAVLHAVRDRLRQADLTPALELDRAHAPNAPSFEFGRGRLPAPRAAIVEEIRRLAPADKGVVFAELKEALAQEAPAFIETMSQTGAAPTAVAESPSPSLVETRAVADSLQVFKAFLVTEDDGGLLIVDQHALHERIMFEKLRQRIDVEALESQRLLMPAMVEADPRIVDALDDAQALLARLGIDAQPAGPRTIAVSSFTSLLFERGVDPIAFMEELLPAIFDADGRTDAEGALHEVLDMMACKAAIKAGDPLTPAEIRDLLDQRGAVERSSNCPHGRPTSLRLTRADLERQFGRR